MRETSGPSIRERLTPVRLMRTGRPALLGRGGARVGPDAGTKVWVAVADAPAHAHELFVRHPKRLVGVRPFRRSGSSMYDW